MPRSGQRSASPRATQQRRTRHANNDGLIPVLARKVREVEAKAADGKKLGPTNRTKFQVIAFLMREERARAKADTELTRCRPRRAAEATRRHRDDPREDRRPRHVADLTARERGAAERDGAEAAPRLAARIRHRAQPRRPDHHDRARRRRKQESMLPPELAEKQVIPQSVKARQLVQPVPRPRLLACRGRRRRRRGGGSTRGSCSVRSSSRSSTGRAARRPAWTSRRRPRSTATRLPASS